MRLRKIDGINVALCKLQIRTELCHRCDLITAEHKKATFKNVASMRLRLLTVSVLESVAR